jgi:hypothetical protein
MTRQLLNQLTEVCGWDDSSGTLPKHEPSVVCNVGWFIIHRSDKNPHQSWDTLLVTSDAMHRELVPQCLSAIMPVLWEMIARQHTGKIS